MATSAALNAIIEALRSRPAAPDMTFEQRRAAMEATQAVLRIPDDVVCETADADGVPVEFVPTCMSSGGRPARSARIGEMSGLRASLSPM